MNESAIENKLAEIKRQLGDTETLPPPTLEIIGASQNERYWQSLLIYFLEHDNPHGFATDVLSAFLEAIATHPDTTFDNPVHDSDQIAVQSEVPTGSGPVDLVLSLGDAWVLCIELKVTAPETGDQTVRYATASTLGDIVVDEHPGTVEYLYLAPAYAAEPASDKFVELSWRRVVESLEQVLRDGQGRYPSKSRGQLADFIDTIKRECNMTDLNEISTETALYSEHYELIDQLKDAYEDDKQRLFSELESAFFDTTDVDRNEWSVSNRGTNYINFYKEPWQHLDTGTSIEYEPHVHLKRDQPRIRLRLDIEKGEKASVRAAFRERLSDTELSAVEAAGWEFVDETYAYLAKSVPIDFEAPTESVREAITALHALREIVEPHIEEVVAAHQPE